MGSMMHHSDSIDMHKSEITDQSCLTHIFQSLTRDRCCFALQGDSIDVLMSPTAFYDRLLHNIQNAKETITISSLYIGIGEMEKKLIACLAEQVRINPQLRVQILLDYARAQRCENALSSVSLFTHLLRDYPLQIKLYLYKVPRFEWIKRLVPSPYNEALGVWHAKIIQTDDKCIITGANLSHDYFTNRQDRYMEMRSSDLATFYRDLIHIVAAYSYRVKFYRNTITLHRATKYSKRAIRDSLQSLLKKNKAASIEEAQNYFDGNSIDAIDTWAIPSLQFGPIGILQDQLMLSTLLNELSRNCRLDIATGYMNFFEAVKKQLLQCKASVHVITASPMANSFHYAKGIKTSLPMAYSLLEKDFYDAIRAHGKSTNTVREYSRKGWTFHMKGIWISHDKAFPSLTVCGSSNYNNRSLKCDMESQLYVYTRNHGLQRKLHEETRSLHKHCDIVSSETFRHADRRLGGIFSWKRGYWLRPALKVIGAYL